MDDPEHTRNPVILEEGVLPYKLLRMSNGDMGGWIWLCCPSTTSPNGKKKSKNNSCSVKAAVRWQLPQQGAQGCHPSVPFVSVLKVNPLLPSTWQQSCLPLSESQLHRCGAVPVKAAIFHTQAHVGMRLHRCATHTHTPRQTPAASTFLAAVEGTDNAFWPVCGEIYRHAHMERLFTAQAHHEAS